MSEYKNKLITSRVEIETIGDNPPLMVIVSDPNTPDAESLVFYTNSVELRDIANYLNEVANELDKR